MPEKIFIDTGFVIALISERDQYHQQVLEISSILDNYSFIITDLVLLEIGNACSRSYKAEAIAIIEKFLNSDNVEVIRLTPELFREAFNFYKIYQDKQWGFIDCVSFVVMRTEGITRSLSFDQHFIQAGFQILP